jgi:hypothetical protein
MERSPVVEHLEMLRIEPHDRLTTGQNRRNRIPHATNRQCRILIHRSRLFIVDGEPMLRETDQQLLLSKERLIRHKAGSAMLPKVSYPRRVVKPVSQALLHVRPGMEFGAFQEIVEDKSECLLFFSFSIWIPNGAEKRFEAVVPGKLEKSRVPDRLLIAPDFPQNNSAHVVEHTASGYPVEVLKPRCQAL